MNYVLKTDKGLVIHKLTEDNSLLVEYTNKLEAATKFNTNTIKLVGELEGKALEVCKTVEVKLAKDYSKATHSVTTNIDGKYLSNNFSLTDDLLDADLLDLHDAKGNTPVVRREFWAYINGSVDTHCGCSTYKHYDKEIL